MDKKSVTGRDGMIVAKALCYAIASIDALPAARREASDRDDMVRLLRAMASAKSLDDYAAGVEWHTGRTPDLTTLD